MLKVVTPVVIGIVGVCGFVEYVTSTALSPTPPPTLITLPVITFCTGTPVDITGIIWVFIFLLEKNYLNYLKIFLSFLDIYIFWIILYL